MSCSQELLEEGKIKYVGVSELDVANLRKAHAVCPITAYQMEWSLFTRDVEEELVPVCRELGIGRTLSALPCCAIEVVAVLLGIVAYSPLGRGFLTGSIKSKDDLQEGDRRLVIPRFNEYLEGNLKLVEVVKEVAAARGCTPSQLALAWLHAQGDDVFPIPGTKRVTRFEENVGGFHVKLTDEDMTKLNEIADKIKGTRYEEYLMPYTFSGAA